MCHVTEDCFWGIFLPFLIAEVDIGKKCWKDSRTCNYYIFFPQSHSFKNSDYITIITQFTYKVFIHVCINLIWNISRAITNLAQVLSIWIEWIIYGLLLLRIESVILFCYISHLFTLTLWMYLSTLYIITHLAAFRWTNGALTDWGLICFKHCVHVKLF